MKMSDFKISISLLAVMLSLFACKQKESKTEEPVMEETTVEVAEEPKAETPAYDKTFESGAIKFHVTSNGKNLTIAPSGFEAVNDEVVNDINGEVTNVEVDDLNNDGFPEILVYVKSGNETSVVAYSSNKNKSMSMVYLPPVVENEEAGKGYEGNNEFAVVEGMLVERFPVGDNWRQIQYKLVDGEASRYFQVDKITEFPK